jgi:hypothetical protein
MGEKLSGLTARDESHTLRYIPQADWHHEPPDWILTHSGEVSYQPPPDITVPGVGVYHFSLHTDFSGFRAGTGFYTVGRSDSTQAGGFIQ